MDEFDILSYGIGMTTLEEVFIKCNAADEDGQRPNPADLPPKSGSSTSALSTNKIVQNPGKDAMNTID